MKKDEKETFRLLAGDCDQENHGKIFRHKLCIQIYVF